MVHRPSSTPPPEPFDTPLHIEVPAHAAEIAGLRRRVGALAATAGMGEVDRAAVVLAVGEACANVVVHAYADMPEPGPMSVTATVTHEGFVVAVADRGRGFAPRAHSPGLGLGMPLMASLARVVEIVEVSPQGAQIRMVFAIPAVEPRARVLRSVD